MPTSETYERIYDVVRQIPSGRVCSYGDIAEAIGTKGGARMVGWAMNASHNSLKPVPAHRVVNRLGMLSGRHHFPTPTAMQEQLEAEGVKVENDCVMDFETLRWRPTEA